MRVLSLLDHLYVRYPVPICLYRTMLSNEGLNLVFSERYHSWGRKARLRREQDYRRWFIALARGESFADLAGNRLTRRQAHWFTLAPAMLSIEACEIWAEAAALGVPVAGCDMILDRYGVDYLRTIADGRRSLFQFYARTWEDLEPEEHIEIIDYIKGLLWDGNEVLKGRTAASIRRQCEAWHRLYENDFSSQRRFRSWKGAFPQWSGYVGSVLLEAIELTDSGQLARESRLQGHCVESYDDHCVSGHSRIVSFHWTAEDASAKRLTLEIRPGSSAVVQIRGRFNRRATGAERRYIEVWAASCGLTVSSHA